MAKLSEHHSSKFTKMILFGDSGTGKTGSLTSLAKAGYNLRILDTDNGLDILRQFVAKECPERLDSIDYETVRDKYVEGPIYMNGAVVGKGPTVKKPTAYLRTLDLLTQWSDGTTPTEWGDNTVFVLDSLTGLGKAAFEWARNMNVAAKDGRQWYGTAQASLENILALLTSEEFRTNVIIISHVDYRSEGENSPIKGYVNAVGAKLGPNIPKYFNTVVLAETSGSGANTRRRIKTLSNGTVDLKTAAPFKIERELELGSGLAELFKTLKEI